MSSASLRAALILAAGLSACAAVPAGRAPDLVGAWRVEDLDSRGVIDRAPLSVTFQEGRVSAFAGCNRLMGAYTQSGGTVKIGPLASTRMACPPALMEQERGLADSLQAVDTVGTGPDEAVRLSGPGGRSLLLRRESQGPSGPGRLALRCGDEDFNVTFGSDAAVLDGPSGATERLPRINAAGADPEAPRVFTNGRMTFTQEIEGGRAVTFARGRMAPVPCALRGG